MSAVREHLIDGAKASPIAGYAYSNFVLGVDWGALGAFVMFIYAVLLVLDKLGLLAPLKGFGSRCWAKFYPGPRPPIRYPEDE